MSDVLLPPMHSRGFLPVTFDADRAWHKFFNEVCGCEGNEAIIIETTNPDRDRTYIMRYAKKLRYQVSTHLRDGHMYVVGRVGKNDQHKKGPEFTYRETVLPPRSHNAK